MITHKLHLDVSKDGVQGNIVLVKGERASRDISFTFSNGKNTVELGEDYSAAFRGIKPDGNELFNSCVVYTENGVYPNTVRYHVTEQTVTAAGTFTARLLIWNREGEVLWSPEFSVTVKEHGSLDSDVESQSEFTALIDAAVQAQNAAKQTENVAAETKKEVGEWLEERDAALGDHVADRVNPHGVTAKQLGLERVDNTSDEEKPLSAAVRAAFAALGGELSTAEAELIDRIAQALISAKFYADETKVGKVGDQVIEGGLSISGDLLVGGDTFAKQIESLEVGDAVIIANADGVLLSELSGYVIRVNGDSAYAIVYDPADDCVKIGLGTYNSETKLFVFLDGEAQVLATRDAIADGHVPVWNDEKKTFEDSGKSADKVVERGADIPNGEIPVLKDGKLIGSGKTASSFASKDSAQVVANALKGSASGTAVALKDVSPLEHILGVKVSSENIADIEAVKVRAQGKNLFNVNRDLETLQSPFWDGDTDTTYHYGYSFDLPAGKYTVSAQRVRPITLEGTTSRYIYLVKSTSLVGMTLGKNSEAKTTYNIEIGENETLYIYNGFGGTSTAFGNEEKTKLIFSEYDIQIEAGTTATEYEPYKEPIEYTVNPDGTVDGVKSIAPATTLTTDTEGVLIEVEYNKDINKAFAELQQAIISLGGNV